MSAYWWIMFEGKFSVSIIIWHKLNY
jgi:hypothetical protein